MRGGKTMDAADPMSWAASPRYRLISITRLRRRSSACAGRRGAAGFTLVEVIVAIAILSLTLTVVLNVIANSIRQTGQAEKMAEAGSLAQSLVATLGTERPVREGLDSGQVANGFRWRLNLQPFGDAADLQQWPLGAYKVSVEVRWDDGGSERSFVLTTLRLAPREEPR